MPNHDPLRRIPPKTVPPMDVDIGSVLKEARLRKGQALDVVSQHTRVPKKLIEALEGNRVDEFPAMVYLRGFLKIYCEYLDVDFEPLWKRIVPDRPQAAPGSAAPSPQGERPPSGDLSRPGLRPGTDVPGGHPTGQAGPGAQARPRPEAAHAGGPRQGGPRIPYAGIAVLTAAVLLFAWLILRRPAEETPAPSAAPAPPPVLQPITQPVEPVVGLSFKKDVWLRVTVDHQVRFEGIAPGGAKAQEYKPKTSFSVRTPNPSDIILTLNGAATDFPKADPDGEHVLPVR